MESEHNLDKEYDDEIKRVFYSAQPIKRKRYCSKHKKEIVERVFVQQNSLVSTSEMFRHANQVELLKCNELTPLMIAHIKAKIQGYKQQDSMKGMLDESQFISFDETVQLLQASHLTCVFCKCPVFILYGIVRDAKQWSIDRIHNHCGHNRGNVQIACLECNLKRRKTADSAFMMTKQMVIQKMD